MFHVVDFCRLCLSYKGDFTNVCNDIFAMEKIMTCVNGLDLDDRLPVLVCTTCMDLVNMIADFRDQCLQSEHLLNHYVEMFLTAGCTPHFVNTKLQVNVFKGFATNKTPGNVKLGCKCFQDPQQRKNLEHKSSCTVQQFKDSLRRSKAYRLHDFEEYCNNNSSEGAAAFSSIFSDDDDIFVEDDEEPQIVEVNSVNLTEHSYNKPAAETATKRKYDDPSEEHEPKKPRSEVGVNVDAMSEEVTDITERITLHKHHIQMHQAPKYVELPNGNVLSNTKKRDCESPHKQQSKNSHSVNTVEIESMSLSEKEENYVEIVSTIEEVPNVDELLKLKVGEVPDLSEIKKQFDANAGIATSTDFETDIEIANYIRKAEEEKKKKEKALSKQIVTSVDFGNDIATYCVAPPQPACSTEPDISLKPVLITYERKFRKFHQINTSSQQKTFKDRSTKNPCEKKKFVKIILPASSVLNSSPDQVPSENEPIANPFTELQSTTGKSVLFKTADLAKLCHFSKITFSPSTLSPNHLVKTVTKEEPEEKVIITSETKNEILKMSPSSSITTDSDSEIKNKVLNYKNEPQGAGSPSKAKETSPCVISNMRAVNREDFHSTVNDLVNNKALKTEPSPENFQTISDAVLEDDKDTQKKRKIKKKKFHVDDPLNMLAFSKHCRRRLNPQNHTNKSKASTKFTPLKEIVDLISYNNVDSPGGTSQASSESYTDLSKSSTLDSEDCEIDVVTVPNEGQYSIPVNLVKDSAAAAIGVRAQNARERRINMRKCMWDLANSIPGLVRHKRQKLTVPEVVKHAQLYISTLKCESELLDSEHHRLLNVQTRLSRQLYHSKFGPKNKPKKGENEPNSETANTLVVNNPTVLYIKKNYIRLKE